MGQSHYTDIAVNADDEIICELHSRSVDSTEQILRNY